MSGFRVLLLVLFLAHLTAAFLVRQNPSSATRPFQSLQSSLFAESSTTSSLQSITQDLTDALNDCQSDLTRICHVRIQAFDGTSNDNDVNDSPNYRLGMVATRDLKAGETVLQIPFDDRYILTADLARQHVLNGAPKDVDMDDFSGWTGDAGLIALQLLQELARAAGAYDATTNKNLPQRDTKLQVFIGRWVLAMPSSQELAAYHPLLWSEEDQEVLQSSSTNKIYRRLDDLEEDFGWLTENVLDKDRQQYPETVTLPSGQTVDCFNLNGFKWALANTLSRAVFVDGCLRLIPLLDLFNHDDDKGKEIDLGYMGTFNTMKGAELTTPVACRVGEQVFCSYGPKSAAEYLLEHGFCSGHSLKTAVAEVTFELNPDDKFYDDKLDILEFETYEQAPMDPIQKFDLVSAPGRDGDPDPALIQFVRLCQLGGTDAFLLESIFKKEVWGFMSLPVSEMNEQQVISSITAVCQKGLDEFEAGPDGGPAICAKIRELERKALTSTMEYLLREKEALDLKEYYQQRRLKDLGLDSQWSPEDDPDVGFGQTRTPGSADYDW